MRLPAIAFLATLALLLLAGPLVLPHDYAEQDRDHISSAPDAVHWLGTDSLGRDNAARLFTGGRLSVAMASVAAVTACLIAAMAGTLGALGGGITGAVCAAAFDVMLSMPWYLLVFLVRAVLPLDAPPVTTAAVTFGILGLVGWAHGARTIRDAVREMAAAAWMRQARAGGCHGAQLWRGHIVPNLWPLLVTQFLLLLPSLMLSEATLGMLGLGIPEPLPSWGGALGELTQPGAAAARPWTLVPAVLLALTSMSLRHLAGGARTKETYAG